MSKFKSFKKLKYILPTCLIIGAVCVGLTIAYFSSQTNILTNSFKVGSVTSIINEDPSIADGVINKNPSVKNTGENDCIVRMRVTISPDEFNDLISNNQNDNININFSNNWELEEDGFYYYKGIVKPDNSTDALFTQITGLTEEIDVKDSDGIIERKTVIKEKYKSLFEKFEIGLYQETVQATVYDSDGKSFSAKVGEDFSLNNAKAIFDLYETGNFPQKN